MPQRCCPSGRYDPATTIAAVADPSRRTILNVLKAENGQPVKALEQALPQLGRHAVLKHIGVLERAGLIVTRKVGRQRLCYLNAIPLLDLARQWTTDYTAAWADRLVRLRDHAEYDPTEGNNMTTDQGTPPDLVQQIVIHAPAQRVWDAITTDESRRWYHDCVTSPLEAGADYSTDTSDGYSMIRGITLEVEAPHLLVQTYDACWDDEVAADEPSTITWRLEQRGPLTYVTVEHRGVAGTGTGRQAALGLPLILGNLKTYVETGTPMPVAQTN